MRALLILLVGCDQASEPVDTSATEPATIPGNPETFGDFYARLQDNVCPLADSGCEQIREFFDCIDRDTTPACTNFSQGGAALCLEQAPTCVNGVYTASSACDEVCDERQRFSSLDRWPEACKKMFACDMAYAAAVDGYSGTWLHDDATYGPTGTCWQTAAGADACEAACMDVNHANLNALQTQVDNGTLDAVPSECG